MKYDNYYASHNYNQQCYSYHVVTQSNKNRVKQDTNNDFWAKVRHLFNSLMSQK